MSNLIRMLTASKSLFSEKRRVFKMVEANPSQSSNDQQKFTKTFNKLDSKGQSEFNERLAKLENKTLEQKQQLAEQILENSGEDSFDKAKKSFDNVLKSKSDIKEFLANPEKFPVFDKFADMYPSQQEALMVKASELKAYSELNDTLLASNLSSHDITHLIASNKINDGLTKLILTANSNKSEGIQYELKGDKSRAKWTIPGTKIESSFKIDEQTQAEFAKSVTVEDVKLVFIKKMVSLIEQGKAFDDSDSKGYTDRNDAIKKVLATYQDKANIERKKIEKIAINFAKSVGASLEDAVKLVLPEQKPINAVITDPNHPNENNEKKDDTIEQELKDFGKLQKTETLKELKLNLSFSEATKIQETGTVEEKRAEAKVATYKEYKFNNADVFSTADGNLKFYSFTDTRDNATYIYQERQFGGQKQIAKIAAGESFEPAAAAMKEITEDYLKDSEYAMLNPTLEQIENIDLNENIQIQDPESAEKIASAVGDREAWAETYSKLAHKERYEHILSKLPTVQNASAEGAKILHTVLEQGPFDDQADFNDFLEAVGGMEDNGQKITDADDFQIKYKNLLETTENQANISEFTQQRLDSYSLYYKVGTHLLNLLKTEKVVERNAMQQSEALRTKIAGLPTTEDLAYNFYTLDSLASAGKPTRLDNDTDRVIGLKPEVDAELSAILGDKIDEGAKLRLLVRTHGLNTLMRTGKIARNGNKLVVIELPAEYKDPAKLNALKPFFETVNKDNLSEETINHYGAHNEVSHEERLVKLRENLGELESTETYAEYNEALTNALKQANDSETITKFMAEEGVDAENGFNKAIYSPEMIANYLLGEETITLDNGETVTMYRYENGFRRVNSFGLQRTLHFLEHLGEHRAEPDFEQAVKEGGLSKEESHHLRSPSKLTKQQAQSIIKGFVIHMEAKRVKQEQKITNVENAYEQLTRDADQLYAQAQAKGFEGNMAEFKEKMLFGLGAAIKLDGSQVESTTLGLMIPIDENVFITVSSTNLEDIGVGIGGSVELFSTKENQGELLINQHFTKDGLNGFAGYIHTFKNEKSAWDAHAFAGLSYNLSRKPGINLVIGAANSYNYENAVNLQRNALVQKVDEEKGSAKTLQEIHDIKDVSEKAKAVLEHPLFSELKDQIAPETAVAVFNVYLEQLDLKANQNAEPPLITSFGAGLMFSSNLYAGAFVGIKLKVGDKLVYVPKLGEAERLAKTENNIDLNKAIAAQNESGKDFVWRQGEFIINENGEIQLTDGGRTLETPMADFDSLKETFAKAGIAVEKAELNGKQVLELIVQDRDGHTVEVFRDPAAMDIGITMQNGRIYLAGNPDTLVVRRSRLRSPIVDYKGASNVKEMIVLSTDSNHKSLQDVRATSAKFLRSVHENGQVKAWEISEGADPKSKTSNWESMDDFQDTYAGMDVQEYKKAMKIIEGTVRSNEKLGKVPTKAERAKIRGYAKTAYENLKNKIAAGDPSIDDNEGLAKAIVDEGKGQFTTPYEIAIAIQEFQDLYFVENRKDEQEKFLKRAETYNN